MKHTTLYQQKKYEVIINVYFSTLDEMISIIRVRFKQETLESIKSVAWYA